MLNDIKYLILYIPRFWNEAKLHLRSLMLLFLVVIGFALTLLKDSSHCHAGSSKLCCHVNDRSGDASFWAACCVLKSYSS